MINDPYIRSLLSYILGLFCHVVGLLFVRGLYILGLFCHIVGLLFVRGFRLTTTAPALGAP